MALTMSGPVVLAVALGLSLAQAHAGSLRMPPTSGSLRTPPMGWSSWYAFGPDMDQARYEATLAKMANWSVSPGSTRSLSDAGYVYANIDDGWQDCGAGVDGSFHSKDGEPLVNKAKFPDISAMTEKAAELGLRPGFYFNNYICAEGMPKGGIGGEAYMRNMRGNVEFLRANRFDFVKLDTGSVYGDLQLWHDLIRDAGREMAVENCHQGHDLPNATWCPFDMFRVSGDLHVIGMDVEMWALAHWVQRASLGCWAYPDTVDPGSAQVVRTQFGVYAVTSAPLLLSFDILDDAVLLPIWDIITNPDAIAVNQAWAGSPGGLVRKWSQHLENDPMYAWAEDCDDADLAQGGWSYDEGTGLLRWAPPAGEQLCLTDGAAFSLQPCGGAGGWHQRWSLQHGRLWEAQADGSRATISAGVLRVRACNDSLPGQAWSMSAETGAATTISNDIQNLPQRCMEILACLSEEGAQVDTLYGCKPLPKPGFANRCEANMAWVYFENKTITSLMNGMCLQADLQSPEGVVSVGTCTDIDGQRWRQEGRTIRVLHNASLCIDSGLAPPPPGTTGRCVAMQVTSDAGGNGVMPEELGPALQMSPVEKCDPSSDPAPAQAFEVRGGRLMAGRRCVAGRRGEPTPFGPLQLWAKAQPGGAAAALLVNRGSREARVDVALAELPGLQRQVGAGAHVRDIWAQEDLPDVSGETVVVTVAPGDSRFLLMRPERGLAEMVW